MFPISPSQPSVVLFGNFDSLHIGHQKLLDNAKRIAQDNKCNLFVIIVFTIPKGKGRNSILQSRVKALRDFGIENIIVYPYTPAFWWMRATNFIKFLCTKYHARHIVTGEDSRFGVHGLGDINTLQKNQKEFNYTHHIIKFAEIDGQKISSSTISKHLESGRLSDIAKLLGREIDYFGHSVQGIGLARRLGFPTANILIDKKVCHGVYAGHAINKTKKISGNSMIYISDKAFEVHIINQHKDRYITDMWGDNFEFVIFEKIRDMLDFKNLSEQEISSVLQKDLEDINQYFNNEGNANTA